MIVFAICLGLIETFEYFLREGKPFFFSPLINERAGLHNTTIFVFFFLAIAAPSGIIKANYGELADYAVYGPLASMSKSVKIAKDARAN